ncbi:DUF6461 domain-containing protein [Dactylosporangium sp. CS-047395]|uniref:DUF6461 domain-containing protein n=1 Tax=Dactylosporangium sp. CS-047395 TaxID=3239936 RepID=UPI003D8F22E2
MTGPTPEQIDHYLDMFEQLDAADWCIGENLGWTVVRAHGRTLTAEDAIRLVGGDPDTVTTVRPVDVRYEDDVVYVEQRGDAVMLLDYAAICAEAPMMRRLAHNAAVHGVFWGINNWNTLFYALDGEVVTELDTLRPDDRTGTDPDALNDHLGALIELDARPDRGAMRDWPTAMATVAALTGLDLDADWFRRPQRCTTVR